MIEITDIFDKRIDHFRTLKDSENKAQDYIVVDSEKVVQKLLSSNLIIKKIFSKSEFVVNNYEFLLKKISKDNIFFASKSIMEQIVGHKLHHGVMAIANRPKFINLRDLKPPIIILNGITSPENVGSIMRSSAAFSINSVVVDGKTVSPYTRRSIRVSMGNVFNLKIHQTSNLYDTVLTLKNSGLKIFSTANTDKSIDLDKIFFPVNSALIIGSEGHGVEDTIMSVSSSLLKIPIDEGVAHLNASCAASIFLYHLTRELKLS